MSSFKISKKGAHTDSRMSIIAKHDQTIENIEESYTMCLKNMIKRNKLCVSQKFCQCQERLSVKY